jgi:hypothetical protein
MRLPDLNARQNRFRATPSRNRHWRIEEYLRRFRQLPLADALAQEIEQLLCSFDRKGWNNDVSPAFEGLFYRTEEFRDRRAQWFVQPVAIRGFHYDIFGVGGVAGLRSSRRPALPKSPENSTLVECPCSESCRKMLASE